ncbi:MAG: hypothetical protein JSV50_16270 [Desulfobacteraceae bacterium]|nr:MAG: hypothetical protein JSV50_16270 [Desulfobacteraceae bacterium]
MGEIKSTLDIIMEKTKGLTMTDEEKNAFQKRETEGKVRGIVQKFLDGLINSKRLKEEIIGLGERQYSLTKEALLRECLDRMEPGADNTPLLDALENAAGLDTDPVQKIMLEYKRDLEQQRIDRTKILKKHLEDRKILGTAVVPNINSDKKWVQYLAEAKRGFKAKVEKLFS